MFKIPSKFKCNTLIRKLNFTTFTQPNPFGKMSTARDLSKLLSEEELKSVQESEDIGSLEKILTKLLKDKKEGKEREDIKFFLNRIDRHVNGEEKSIRKMDASSVVFQAEKIVKEGVPLARSYFNIGAEIYQYLCGLKKGTNILIPLPELKKILFKMVQLIANFETKKKEASAFLEKFYADRAADEIKDDFNAISELTHEFRKELTELEKLYFTIASLEHFYRSQDDIEALSTKSDELFIGTLKKVLKSRSSSNTFKETFLHTFLKKKLSRVLSLKKAIALIKKDVSEISGNYAKLDLESQRHGFKSLSSLEYLGRKLYSELRGICWDLQRNEYGSEGEKMYSEVYSRVSRVFEQRRIATAKWNMRSNALRKKKASAIAQKEGITLGQLELEIFFKTEGDFAKKFKTLHERDIDLPKMSGEFYPEGEVYKLAEKEAKYSKKEFPFKVASLSDFLVTEFKLRKEKNLSLKNTNTKGVEFIDYGVLEVFMMCHLLKIAGRDIPKNIADKEETFQKETQNKDFLKLLEENRNDVFKEFEPFFKEEISKITVGPKEKKKPLIKLTGIRVCPDTKVEPKKAVHYRHFYPQRNAPKRELSDGDGDKKDTSAKYIAVKFKIEKKKAEESAILRFFKNWILSPDSVIAQNKLCCLIYDAKLCDKDSPFELSEYRSHQTVTEKAFNLTPWVPEKKKKFLGIEDELRTSDDPIELVEDDAFCDYWRDIGVGMTPDRGVRCDMHVRTSTDHVMNQCASIILKHLRTVFCNKRKIKQTRRSHVMLKSAHVHGKSKDRVEEVVLHHVYTFVVPDGMRSIVERAADETISAGSTVRLIWKENI